MKPSSVSRLEVKDLFGHYSYRLPEEEPQGDIARLMILYGDNGSGKTTILRALFHLLAHESEAGHKSVIAKIPFRSFEVTLSDGTVVTAIRKDESITGSFELQITPPRKPGSKAILTVGDDGTLRGDDSLPRVLDHLKSLGLSLFMLSDGRQLRGLSSSNEELDSYRIQAWAERRRREEYMHESGPPSPVRWYGGEVLEEEGARSSVTHSIKRFEVWIRRQAMTGSSKGQRDSDSVYVDVMRRIVNLDASSKSDASPSFDELNARVARLEVRAKDYSQYGLVPRFRAKEFKALLADAPMPTRHIAHEILNPYVEGLEARLEALGRVQRIIDNVVNSINSFLSGKKVKFDVRTGLKVLLPNSKRLSPKHLSSGERQILILLCNCAVAPERSVFIVDEPELSLNVKWQRVMTKALLACTEHSEVQFILATHSFEILARHKDCVVPLKVAD